jgi:GntR family transcriptional regulator
VSPRGAAASDTPPAITGGSSSLRAFRSLQRALQAGDYPAGSRLPAERTLAASIGASRTSVREALKALADSGLIVASPHRGWFVAGATYREGPNLLRSFSQSATDRGLTAGAEIISRVVRPATLDEADQLGLAPASPLLELIRLRRMNDVPISVSTSCLPLDVAGPLAEMDLSDRSLFEALARECGIVVNSCRYEVQAAPASPAIGEMLLIPPGSPVLIGAELIFDERDRAVIVGSSTYRGDAYRFQATLFRG